MKIITAISNLKNWQQIKLSSVATINMGQSPPSSAYNEINDGLPLIQGNIDIKRDKTISRIWTKNTTKVADKGDIILTVRAPVGALGIAHERVCLGRGVCSIKSDYKSFIWYYLKYFKDKWNILEQGSTFSAVNSTDIRNLKIDLPSFAEQSRIVAVLEKWDKAIEKLKKKIEIKKQIKKGLMHELLTGKIRLERHKDPWVTTTLGEVSGFVNGYTFKSSTYTENGSYMVITIANVQDGQMVIDEPKTIRDLPENINKDQVLQKGDLLISMTGNVGRVCIVDRNFCLLNQRVGKIKERGLSRELLYFILNDRRFLNKMIDSAQGGAQGNLSTTDIKKYSFKIPKSKEEQHDITNILTTANNEIRILERKFNILQGQKKYLLNNLITGTIRTPENLLVS